MAEYRLEELARATGVSVRNIRAYRERGLLDPPRKVGRAAVYDDYHLSQLETINQLLRRGFTTAHIAEFFSTIRAGHDLAEILGVQQAVFGPRRDDVAVTVDVDHEEAVVGPLRTHGLVEVADGEVRLVDSELADLVGGATDHVDYLRAMQRVADGIADGVDGLAAALVRALEASVADRFGQNYFPKPDEVADARRIVADYRAVGQRVVTVQLDRAFNRHLVAAVSAYITDLLLNGE